MMLLNPSEVILLLLFVEWATVGLWGHLTTIYVISLKQVMLSCVVKRELVMIMGLSLPLSLLTVKVQGSSHLQWSGATQVDPHQLLDNVCELLASICSEKLTSGLLVYSPVVHIIFL